MSVLRHKRELDQAKPLATSRSGGVPRIRSGTAWAAACIAAVASVVLTVFLLQNTGGVEVSFLWMHGSVSLALALLMASAGAAILTMVVGIGQLRRVARRNG